MTQLTSTPTDEIKTRKVELVLQQLDTLPTLPAIALRLMSLTGTPDAKIQEVVQLLSVDQSLTSKLLSLANSAMVGLRSPITSVQQAVVMLGFAVGFNVAGFAALVPAGIGVTLYGLTYALVHDVYIHRRLALFGDRSVPGLERLAAAHRVHHERNAAPYGMLLPVRSLSGRRPPHQRL